MAEPSVEDRIKQVLARDAMAGADASAIRNRASLLDELGLDSVQIIELIAGIEAEFGISVGNDDLSMTVLRNVNTLAALVRGKLREKSGTGGRRGR